jgi:EAL domain-containing protein (putative c-di-GMP-specific phosphodiesterase class I)
VAEGVESQAQLDFLRANDCDEMQGYFFAAPMSAADCAHAVTEGWRLPI